jgi:flagellar secretion chaperone FliS
LTPPAMNRHMLGAYHKSAVDAKVNTATPHELIAMIFEGLLETLNQALGALERHDTEAQGKLLHKALRLINEGLIPGLDMQRGGELAQNLSSVYDYAATLLIQAHAKRDPERVHQVIRLIRPVADAWAELPKLTSGGSDASHSAATATGTRSAAYGSSSNGNSMGGSGMVFAA